MKKIHKNLIKKLIKFKKIMKNSKKFLKEF